MRSGCPSRASRLSSRVTGGSAGRAGDFLTSPEVGPLFGAVLARALDAWWEELGEPAPFTVVEAGYVLGLLGGTFQVPGDWVREASSERVVLAVPASTLAERS